MFPEAVAQRCGNANAGTAAHAATMIALQLPRCVDVQRTMPVSDARLRM
jgi:hypothetical protein